MKKKIAILGSTGSIGKTLIEIIKKDKKNFEVILLTAQKNEISLLKQAKLLNVKNLIVTNSESFQNAIKKNLIENLIFTMIIQNLIKFLKEKLIML